MPRDAEHLTLHVVVGPLPAHARVIVRLENGEVAGAIAPYGRAAATSGGSYDVPIPRSAVHDGSVTLRLQVEEKRGGPTRAPTDDEVRQVSIR